MAHDVFLSYSSKDKPAADAVCSVLERHDIRCWMAPRDLLPGRDWAASIVDAIKSSKAFILIFSKHSNASVQVGREIERAISKGIPIIPFRIEDVTPSQSMEYYLSTPHWMDAFPPPMDQHFERLAHNISVIVSGTGELKPQPSLAPRRLGLKTSLLAGASLSVLILIAGTAYFFLGISRSDDLSRCDKPAESPETDSNRLNSFVYYSPETNDKVANRRSWSRPQSDTWIEQSIAFTNHFDVDGRIHLPYCDGTVVSKKGDQSLQLFLADKNCSFHFLEFRRKPSCNWLMLPGMEEIQ